MSIFSINSLKQMSLIKLTHASVTFPFSVISLNCVFHKFGQTRTRFVLCVDCHEGIP